MVRLTDTRREIDLHAIWDPVVGDAAVKLLEGDSELEPGQMSPEALVIATAEGHVAVGLSGVVHRIGVIEDGLVTIGGADHQQYRIALLELDPTEGDPLLDHSRHHHHRCLVPKKFLDGGRNECRILGELASTLRMPGEVHHHAIEGGGNRVEPAEQHEVADAEQLIDVERTTLELGIDQLADQSVVGLAAGCVDDLLEVGADGLAGGCPNGSSPLEVARFDVQVGRCRRAI